MAKESEKEIEKRLKKREGSRISVPRLIGALLIAAAVLAFAFMQGYMISYLNYQKVSNMQETLKIDLMSTELSGQLLTQCNEDAFSLFSKSLDRTGSLLSLLEEKFGKDDANVLEQKKEYTLLEIQHFLAIQKYKEQCDKEIDTILFFYSNNDKESEQGQITGDILSRVKDERDKNVMIYSFDYNLDMDIVRLLKELYFVDSPNTIVINNGLIVYDVGNIDEVNKYLD